MQNNSIYVIIVNSCMIFGDIMSLYFLTLKQTQEKLDAWQGVSKQHRPKVGWIKTIRNALRMTSAQLGARMGVSQAQAIKIEQAEQVGALTLNNLKRAAEALDCKLVYCVVPNATLEDVLRVRAKKLATRQMEDVGHSMMLEQQGLSEEGKKVLFEKLVEEILHHPDSTLWDE